jgi:hypothetical protein
MTVLEMLGLLSVVFYFYFRSFVPPLYLAYYVFVRTSNVWLVVLRIVVGETKNRLVYNSHGAI